MLREEMPVAAPGENHQWTIEMSHNRAWDQKDILTGEKSFFEISKIFPSQKNALFIFFQIEI